MKQNDWLVASINNPNYSASDFRDLAGLTLDNTQFLSKEDYLQSNFIRDNKLFKDKDGNFKKEKFDQFYNMAAKNFIGFSSDDALNDYQYSMWDVTRPANGKVRNEDFSISRTVNPEQITIGVAGLQEMSNPTRSRRSLAQDSKIYDPESGKYLDKSVNDISLFSNPFEYIKSLFDEPLVYATYDQDTIETDPITGREIKHLKGEWKTNQYGQYYTEKLNGRNILDKTVVSASDYITSEHSPIQKYDFFDSDDLDKSTIGSIANNIVSLLPLATPIGGYYAGLTVARELAKTAPMISGILTGLTTNTLPNNKLLNTIAAYGQKFSGSTSDYSSENTFSAENLFNMIGDIVSQFYQQKAIVNTFNKIVSGNKSIVDSAMSKAALKYDEKIKQYYKDIFDNKMSSSQFKQLTGFDASNIGSLGTLLKSGKWQSTPIGKKAIDMYLPEVQKVLEKRGKAGANLALAYMAIVSNSDVYNSILQKNGTPFEAAAIALGSTIGMFTLDKYLGLGELLYEQDPARKSLRQAAIEAVESYVPKQTEQNTTKNLINNIQQGIKLGQKAIDKYRYNVKNGDLGIVGKAIGEALEETGEELITDFTKKLGEIAGQFGYFSQTDYGSWDNAFERYSMSFLGGMLGGTIYGAQSSIENRGRKAYEFQNDVTYLLRQGKKQELIDEINKVIDQGYGGSKNIAYQQGEDGAILTADNERESQAEHNRKSLINIINQLDMILNEHNLNLSEDDLFDKMVQGDLRADALKDWLKGNDIASAKSISYISRFQEDFNTITQNIINKQNEINQLSSTTQDEAKSSQDYKKKLDNLEADLQDLLKQKEYLFGEGSLGYVEKTLFAMDPILAQNFGFLNYNQYIRAKYGVDSSQLTQEELETANKEWGEYTKSKIKSDVDSAFKIYKSMESSIAPSIQELAHNNFQEYIDNISELKKNFPYNKVLELNDKLPGQTDDEYLSIFTKHEDEDEQTYNNRVNEHYNKINQYNKENLYKWIQEYLNNSITTNDQRYIASQIPIIKSQILEQAIKGITLDNLELQGSIRDLVKTYGDNDPKQLRDSVYKEVKKIISKKVRDDIKDTGADIIFGSDFEALSSWSTMLSNMSQEDKELNNVPLDYVFDNNGIIDYYDFKVLMDYLLKKNNDQNKVNEWFSDYGIDLSSNPIYYKIYMSRKLDVKLPTDDIPAIISDEVIENQKTNVTDTVFKTIDSKIITPFLQTLSEDDIYQSLQKLVSANFTKNPALLVVNQVSKNSPNKDINLEQFLTDIYNTYNNGKTAQDFQLSTNQIDTLNQFLQDLSIAQSYIYAASTDSTLPTPVGHNKSINSFVNKHKDVFTNAQELPELDSKTANFLISELNSYRNEIQSWIDRHNINTQDRDAKLLKIEPAITKTITDYFKINREAFKVNDIDLLDGFESINLDNSLSSVLSIEELLYQNYNKFIKSGYTLNYFLDAILPKITKIENIINQNSTKLDENIDYSSLTDYDKFQIFISNIAASSRDYYSGLLKFLQDNEKIAPIAPQEYVSKMVYSQQKNPQLINDALNYISNKLGNPLQVLENTSIVLGVGGAGKTFAVAGLNLGYGDNVIVSGPEQDQVINLQNSLPKSTPMSKNDLLNSVFGGKQPDLSTLYTTNKTSEGISIIKLKSNLPIVSAKDKINSIVIDESTHFSSPEVSIISEFSKKNGINLLLIGDDHQNGYNEGKIHNIQKDQALAWRTPMLSLSLRSNNILKSANLNPLVNIIDELGSVPMSNLAPIAKKVYNESVKDLEFIYNSDNNLLGELITDKLTQEILSKLPKSPDIKIGFIGDQTSSAYQELVKAGYSPIVKSPKQVQGGEFDYTVIDQKWSLNINPNDWTNTGVEMIQFVQNLYTLASRSRNGSIFIDNGLSSIVSNRQVKYSGTASTIEQSVQKFRETRFPVIEKALKDSDALPINQSVSTIELTTNKNKIAGLQSKTGDTTKITFPNKPTVTPNEINLTPEEIVGSPEKYSSEKEYQDKLQEINKGFTIDQILVNNDKTVSIIQGNNTIKTTKTIDDLFNPNSKKGDNKSDEQPKQDTTQQVNTPQDSNNKDHSESIDNDDVVPPINTAVILGSEINNNDLGEEKEKELDNKQNDDEIKESINDDNKFSINFDYPVTVFSNVSYSGIDTSTDIWTNENDSTSDLGIFIRPGDKVEKGNQSKYVLNVLSLKNIFKYGTDFYDRLDPSIRKRFKKKSFEEAITNNQFYIQVEDINNTNRLIGLTKGTGLSNDDRSTYKNKVIKLVAKIRDNDGKLWTISLGGLNKPDTWKANIGVIESGIQNSLKNNPDQKDLIEYSNNLENIIDQYRSTLDYLINKGEEVQIETPKFSGNTKVYKLGNSYRLENINNTFSPYDSVSPYQVKSDPYINLDDLPGISNKVKGKAVMFVSDNLFLYPGELKQIYINQLNNPLLPKQVRMLVLDNVGVSFQSLFTKKYTDLYKNIKGNITFTVPFRAAPMAVRMYISMWNFRAGLSRFLSSYQKFKDSNKFTDSYIETLTREESELFLSMQKNNPELNELTFRNSCTDEQKQKFKVLWDFNDNLSDWCKEFKLGYNDIHGAYIRTFNNINSNFYPNTDKVLGVYIDYQTASQYKQSLDSLFDNIINKIFPINAPNKIDKYITTKLRDLEGWFNNDAPPPLTLNFKDEDTQEQVTVKLDDHNKLASLPFTLIKVGNYMEQYSRYPSMFQQWDQDGTLPKKYYITIEGINEGQPLNWGAALEPFSDITEFDNQVSYSKGKYIVPVDRAHDVGIKDCRVPDMFNLMFHGLVSTKVPNDFTRNDIRADYAYFKYGFFTDPLVVQRTNLEDDQQFDTCLTNLKLLACDAAAGGGYIAIKLSPVQKQNVIPEQIQERNEQTNINKQLEDNLHNILSQIGKDKAIRRRPGISIEDFFKLVKTNVGTAFRDLISVNTQIDTSNFYNIIESINRQSNTSPNIIINKLSDRPEFKGKHLVSVDNQSEYKILTFDNGDVYRMYVLNDEVKIDKQNTPGNISGSYNINDVTNSINNILSNNAFSEAIDEEIDPDDIQDIISRYFKNNPEISRNTYLSLINNVQVLIGNSDIEDNIKQQIKDELGKLKNTDCII